VTRSVSHGRRTQRATERSGGRGFHDVNAAGDSAAGRVFGLCPVRVDSCSKCATCELKRVCGLLTDPVSHPCHTRTTALPDDYAHANVIHQYDRHPRLAEMLRRRVLAGDP
jgi:hypothetical protein